MVKRKTRLSIFTAGVILFVLGMIIKMPLWAKFTIYFASYLFVGGEVVYRALRNLVKGELFDENFLMTLATIGAFAIKEFPEAVAVMLFYQIGEYFQHSAVDRSRKSISELMDIRPDYANLVLDNQVEQVDPQEVRVGEVILVKPGERIPLDGEVISGRSVLDTSALTGESLPKEVEPGQQVLSGSVNLNGLLHIKVTKLFGESTVSRILDMVQNAGNKKAPTENFITKFARYYTPGVVFAALALAIIPPLFIAGEGFSEWIHRALVFLVVSCPCALVISIPVGFFGGIGGASRKGILIKGSNYLEALNNVDTVVFDKTGTLTKGVFQVTKIVSDNKEEIIGLAAYAESYSNHPLAKSILEAYGKEVDTEKIEKVEEIPGHGVKVKANGKSILAGSHRIMKKEGINISQPKEIGTIVHVAADGDYLGYLVISDEVRDDAKEAVAGLRDLGVKNLVMLTGDRKAVGDFVAKELDLDQAYSELLPDQKVAKLEGLDKAKTSRGKLVFVGDGINDAPVLTRADVGVAMGGLGADAAIEAADIVIMNDEPSKLVAAIKQARRTRRIVWQNIVFALAIKLIVLVMGAGGIATMWEAVFADVGVALIAVLNALRVMKSKD